MFCFTYTIINAFTVNDHDDDDDDDDNARNAGTSASQK